MSRVSCLKLISSGLSNLVKSERVQQVSVRSVSQLCVSTTSIRPLRRLSTAQIVFKGRQKHTSSKIHRQQDSEEDSDSDSDDEDHFSHTRGESEFWRRKMRTIHRILDVNKDGVIAFDDMKIFADRFVKLGHLSKTHQAEFHDSLQTMWGEHFGSLDKYNLISIRQYLEIMHHSLNDPKLRKKVHHFLPYLFKAVDKDGNGIISLDEFKLFFRCLGLRSEAAVVSFSVIDENTDGKLSLREFVQLGREYFLTENPQLPSKVLWGPLAD